MNINLSNAITENFFVSEETITKRYLAERKFLLLISMGDYEGVKQLLDNSIPEPDSFLDFEARNPSNAEQSIRDLALVANTSIRICLLQTHVPVTILHGLATYWGRMVRNAPIELFTSHKLFDSMFRSYCEIAREFSQKRYSPTVDRIVNYISYHLSSQITPAQIAEKFNYSSVYINRLLKKETGYSTVQYIKHKRISLAKILFVLNDMSLEDVATAVGYTDYNYFCRIFKQTENISPAQYRKKMINSI